MKPKKNSAAELFERFQKKNPAYLDLFTAETVDEFEAAFNVLLGGAVTHLESNKNNFESLGEVGCLQQWQDF